MAGGLGGFKVEGFGFWIRFYMWGAGAVVVAGAGGRDIIWSLYTGSTSSTSESTLGSAGVSAAAAMPPPCCCSKNRAVVREGKHGGFGSRRHAAFLLLRARAHVGRDYSCCCGDGCTDSPVKLTYTCQLSGV